MGNSIYKIYDPLIIKLLARLRLGFSHLSKHKFEHNFAGSFKPLCCCSLETESTLYFFLRCQNYTTLRRALKIDLKILMMPLCLQKVTYFILCRTKARILITR